MTLLFEQRKLSIYIPPKSVKLLSDREQKVVSLRIGKGLLIKEINIVIGTQREATSNRIYGKALKRIKKYYEEE